jgi:hypothetical protein
MISGTNATGRRCKQRSQTTQHHGWPLRSCSRVGAGGAGFMPQRSLYLRHLESHNALWQSQPLPLNIATEWGVCWLGFDPSVCWSGCC